MGRQEQPEEALSWLRAAKVKLRSTHIRARSTAVPRTRVSAKKPRTGTDSSSQRHFMTCESWQSRSHEEYGHVTLGAEAGVGGSRQLRTLVGVI